MRRLISLALTVLTLSLSATANAVLITFVADLSPLNEVPAVAGSSGSGSAQVVYDDVAHQLSIEAQWQDLTGTTTVSHIHCCAGVTGTAGVATFPGTFPGFPVGVTSGTYSGIIDLTSASSFTQAFVTSFAGGISDNAEEALIANMLAGLAYFNIHSSFAPAGEIRGQLRVVPEPGALFLLGAGLLAFALVRRRPRA